MLQKIIVSVFCLVLISSISLAQKVFGDLELGQMSEEDQKYHQNYYLEGFPWFVSGLEAKAGDSEVTLTWDESFSLEGEIINYRVYYGKISGEKTFQPTEEQPVFEYENNEFTLDAITSHTITGLENDQTYYFSVVAVDGLGEESYDFSREISATPMQSFSSDTTPPTLLSADHSAESEVTVAMSEEIKSGGIADYFTFTDTVTGENIHPNTATTEGNGVFFTFDIGVLQAGKEYRVLASAAVEDLAGNPVSSGLIDSTTFFAKAADSFFTKTLESNDKNAEEILVEDLEVFEDPVKPDDSLDFYDGWHQSSDQAGEEIYADENISLHQTIYSDEERDVGNLFIDRSFIDEGRVNIFWEVATGIAEHRVYVKIDHSSWNLQETLPAGATSYELLVKGGKNYEVKVVGVFSNGDETIGMGSEFFTQLATSGPAENLFFLSLALVSFFWYQKRVLARVF